MGATGRLSAFIGLAALALSACSRAPEIPAFSGPSMGSHYSVKMVDIPPGQSLDQIHHQVQALLDDIEQVASTWRKDSELSRFNQAPIGSFVASETLRELVTLALQGCQETGGALDVTVGPLVNLWGFGPDMPPDHLPPPAQLAAAKARVGCQHLQVSGDQVIKDADIYVDLSSVTQGYAGVKVGGLLDHLGVKAYLLDMSGELLSKGRKPDGEDWHIAVEVPQVGKMEQDTLPTSVEKIVSLKGKAIATSGDYRNFLVIDGKRVSHIIDPVTGEPVSHGLASVTIMDDDLAWADAMATALMVMGPEKGLAFAEQHHMPALLIVRTENGFAEKMAAGFEQYISVQ